MSPPKASTNLSVAKALNLSGRLVEDLRQVSRAPKRVCAAAWNSSFEYGTDRKGAPSPNEFSKRSLAENTEAMRRWSAVGKVIGAGVLLSYCLSSPVGASGSTLAHADPSWTLDLLQHWVVHGGGMKCRRKLSILQTHHELFPAHTGVMRCIAQALRGSTTTKMASDSTNTNTP